MTKTRLKRDIIIILHVTVMNYFHYNLLPRHSHGEHIHICLVCIYYVKDNHERTSKLAAE